MSLIINIFDEGVDLSQPRPTVAPSDAEFDSDANTLTWSAGNGEQYLVVVDSTGLFTPKDNVSYPVKYTKDGVIVLYRGKDTELTGVDELLPPGQYTAYVFSFNGQASNEVYNTTPSSIEFEVQGIFEDEFEEEFE